MLAHTKVFGLTIGRINDIRALLALILTPGAPFGHAQGKPTAAARTRIGRLVNYRIVMVL